MDAGLTRPERSKAELERLNLQLEQSQRRLEHLNAELTRSNKELERFAYVASHDLSEPLRAISAFTKRLADRYGDTLDETAHEWIFYITDGADRMRTLIQALLAYSRVGRDPLVVEEVDVAEVLEATSRDLGNLEFTRDEMPTLRADENQLRQVFQNLISNACKFVNGDSPVVHVGAERGEGEWVFCVRDNGIGIEPKYAERIFEPFERLHTREAYAGAGIGLAVCRRVVERHGGRIWAQPNPDEGTSFYFTIKDQ